MIPKLYETYEEFVIARLLSRGVDDDCNVVMRERWFGFGSDGVTWGICDSQAKASRRALCKA
jgi:hypothetical protein